MKRYVNLRLKRQVGASPGSVGLSDHPDLTIETIESLPEYPWEFDTIDTHPNFRLDWVERLPEKPWSWSRLHINKSFSYTFVEKFLDKPWNWTSMSRKVTLQTLKTYPHFPWDWVSVTVCSDITPTEMAKSPEFPWRIDLISFNQIEDSDLEFLYRYRDEFTVDNWIDFTTTASWEIIKKTFDLYWVVDIIKFDSVQFTQNDIDFFKLHLEYTWNWAILSLMVPFDLIRDNLDLPWVHSLVSMNPSITYDDVVSCPHIEWDILNTPCEPVERIIRKWTAASCIKRYFKRAISDPNYKMCRDRINREFLEM